MLCVECKVGLSTQIAWDGLKNIELKYRTNVVLVHFTNFYQLSLGYILFKAADKAVIFNQLLGL